MERLIIDNGYIIESCDFEYSLLKNLNIDNINFELKILENGMMIMMMI